MKTHLARRAALSGSHLGCEEISAVPGSWLRQGSQVSLYLLKSGESRTARLSRNVQISIREGSECEFHRKSRRSKSRSTARYGRPEKIRGEQRVDAAREAQAIKLWKWTWGNEADAEDAEHEERTRRTRMRTRVVWWCRLLGQWEGGHRRQDRREWNRHTEARPG